MKSLSTKILSISICSIALGAAAPAAAAIDCTDCIFDADGDWANEEDDDLVDICLGEGSPSWSATCEAYDFNDDGAVGFDDVTTWDSECGSQPIVCERGCRDCIYDADGDGFNEEDDDLVDICLGETDPTWSPSCEAYDFDEDAAVGLPDVTTWDAMCGSAPIACEHVTTSSVPLTSSSGRMLVVLALMLGSICVIFTSRRGALAG